MGQFIFGIFAGVFGVAYIVYGRRQTKLVPVISGLLLCVYSYFIESWVWLSLVGVVLLAAPFVIDF
jgi:hypothetical protein